MTHGKWNNDGELVFTDIANTASDMNISFGEVQIPIGGILSWDKSLSGVPQTLPQGYVEANGQTLSDADSPLNGQVIPNLNGFDSNTQRFLRGNSTSGGTGGSDTTPNHTHTIIATPILRDNAPQTTEGIPSSTTTTGEAGGHTNLPPYYESVWIVRIK